MIVAALIALAQIASVRTGKPSVIAVAVQAVAVGLESATAAVSNGARSGAYAIVSIPRLGAENAELRREAHALKVENRALRERVAQMPDAQALVAAKDAEPSGIAAAVVGYDPEDAARTVTVDRGARSGVARDDGVVTDDGVVGRVASVTPLGCTVQLLTDATSKVPAIVQRGRWWGIATGVPQSDDIALEYISQDANVRTGDVVVTGEGRSFHAGYTIGTVVKVFHPEGALYQTAMVRPSVRFGRLHGVVIVPRPGRAAR